MFAAPIKTALNNIKKIIIYIYFMIKIRNNQRKSNKLLSIQTRYYTLIIDKIM